MDHILKLRDALNWRTMLPRHGPGVRQTMQATNHKNPLNVRSKNSLSVCLLVLVSLFTAELGLFDVGLRGGGGQLLHASIHCWCTGSDPPDDVHGG